MTAVILTGHGGYEMLEVRGDWPVPVAGPGEVLVEVAAAGVNNTDINTRLGWYSKAVTGSTGSMVGDGAAEDGIWSGGSSRFPFVQGADVCGRIVEVGPGIDRRRVGERVVVDPVLRPGGPVREGFLGSERDGGFAQFVSVPADNAVAIESGLSAIELASIPCAYGAAENMLVRSATSDGDVVVVTGASGGVGVAAVQLAAARGATVIAVTRPDKRDAVLALGAERVVDRGADLVQAVGESEVDVVIDVVGGPAWSSIPDILRPGGRCAVAGAISGPMVEIDLRTLYLKDLSVFGCTMYPHEVFTGLVKRVAAGEVRPVVAGTYPLEEIARAQEAFLAKDHIGKIVLVPAG
jgi:NADPH:quinone reductase-like Zn-dependent oxidoreductase